MARTRIGDGPNAPGQKTHATETAPVAPHAAGSCDTFRRVRIPWRCAWTRTAGGLAGVALVLLASPDAALAQEVVPVVTIGSTAEPGMIINACIDPADVRSIAGEVEFVRTDAENELVVNVTITGPVEDGTDQILFESGVESVSLPLEPRLEENGSDNVDVALVEGAGYSLGEPSAVSIPLAVATADCIPPTTTPEGPREPGSTTGPSGESVAPTATAPTTAPPMNVLPETGLAAASVLWTASMSILLGTLLVRGARRRQRSFQTPS